MSNTQTKVIDKKLSKKHKDALEEFTSEFIEIAQRLRSSETYKEVKLHTEALSEFLDDKEGSALDGVIIEMEEVIENI